MRGARLGRPPGSALQRHRRRHGFALTAVHRLRGFDRLRLTILSAAAILLVVGAAVHGRSEVLSAMRGLIAPFVTIAAIVLAGGASMRWRPVAGALERIALAPRAFAGGALVVLLLTAVASAFVNLDVAVVIAMPLALIVASVWGTEVAPLAMSVAFTANATSILLPTSNLTNLLIVGPTASASSYLSASWLAWSLIVVTTVVGATWFVARRDRGAGFERGPRTTFAFGWSPASVVLDLAAMFLLASGVRSSLPAIDIHGTGVLQVGAVSALAAVANNLPVAAALHPVGMLGRWASVLGAAIGPNLVVTGSVATIICRRIARDNGGDLPAVRFTVWGAIAVPVQLAVAYVGLAVLHVV